MTEQTKCIICDEVRPECFAVLNIKTNEGICDACAHYAIPQALMIIRADLAEMDAALAVIHLAKDIAPLEIDIDRTDADTPSIESIQSIESIPASTAAPLGTPLSRVAASTTLGERNEF